MTTSEYIQTVLEEKKEHGQSKIRIDAIYDAILMLS